jgi:hypothetical protein
MPKHLPLSAPLLLNSVVGTRLCHWFCCQAWTVCPVSLKTQCVPRSLVRKHNHVTRVGYQLKPMFCPLPGKRIDRSKLQPVALPSYSYNVWEMPKHFLRSRANSCQSNFSVPREHIHYNERTVFINVDGFDWVQFVTPFRLCEPWFYYPCYRVDRSGYP